MYLESSASSSRASRKVQLINQGSWMADVSPTLDAYAVTRVGNLKRTTRLRTVLLGWIVISSMPNEIFQTMAILMFCRTKRRSVVHSIISFHIYLRIPWYEEDEWKIQWRSDYTTLVRTSEIDLFRLKLCTSKISGAWRLKENFRGAKYIRETIGCPRSRKTRRALWNDSSSNENRNNARYRRRRRLAFLLFERDQFTVTVNRT